ncbi:MAG: AI-2E family transporter [Pseudomonadota bacterium]|jgi:Predicted permease
MSSRHPESGMEDIATAPWLRRLIVVVLLAGVVLLSFQVLQPFIVSLVWAGILAYVTWPLYVRLERALGGRRTFAALLMTSLLTAAVIIPTVWLIAVLRVELINAYREVAALLARGPQIPEQLLRLPWIGEWLTEMTARMAEDPRALGEELRQLIDRSFGEVARIVGGVGRNAVKVVITVISLFFMYRDGRAITSQVARVLEQLLGARVHNYLDAIGQTVKAVVHGLVLAALAQGTLAGIGYWAVGLEAPVFLGALTTLSALIPFAVPFVWGSIGVWLIVTGKTGAGVALLLWGATAVSWIDNIIRPLVISNATRIPFLLVMFGVLGGLGAFGLVGLFVGPVILAVLVAIWREWLLETRARA